MSYTLAVLHAHPDDEALLTGGTMARAAACGHRVVCITATDGERGLSGEPASAGAALGQRRVQELSRATQVLGCARLVRLGYPDSGLNGENPSGLVHLPPEEVAERVATILREESADVLTVYDPSGGYGHPDHVAIHHIGVRAAALAETPVVFEATVDRERLIAALRVVRALRFLVPVPSDFQAGRFRASFTAKDRLTHRVDAREYAACKRAALAAHASQASGLEEQRTLAWLLRLPRPLFRQALGAEWFVERHRDVGSPAADDVFRPLRRGLARLRT